MSASTLVVALPAIQHARVVLTRRQLLLGVLVVPACAPADISKCTAASQGMGGSRYCSVQSYMVRAPGARLLEPGQAMLVNVDSDTAVIVARDAAGYHAISGVCTHQCCLVSLCETSRCDPLITTADDCGSTGAHATAGQIYCGCHGSQFQVQDGSVISGPALMPLPSYALVFEGDDALVDTGSPVDAMKRV